MYAFIKNIYSFCAFYIEATGNNVVYAVLEIRASPRLTALEDSKHEDLQLFFTEFQTLHICHYNPYFLPVQLMTSNFGIKPSAPMMIVSNNLKKFSEIMFLRICQNLNMNIMGQFSFKIIKKTQLWKEYPPIYLFSIL